MKKKALSLVLASAMVASLVGCGSSAETETPSAAETTTTEAAATTEAASTEAAATETATTDNSDKKIAMVTDSGDITDESFNQITWETCLAYGEAN